MSKKLTRDEFINRSNKTHDNKYNYSSVNYINNKTKVKIICPIHGEFEQIPYHHIKGSSCPNCYGNDKKDTYQFIKKSILVHGNKYDYSLVEYKNAKTKVKIICPIHGVFEQIPNKHLSKQKCPECSTNYKMSIEKYIIKSKEIHCDKYDYTYMNFNTTKDKIKIKCKKHGFFYQNADNHISKKYGCPQCNESKGEYIIRFYLEKNNINYEYQKSFINCKNINKLNFDFYLPNYNICIEYDGIQHFKPISFFGGEKSFNKQQTNDKIKNNYCIKNNIKLIRIPYYDFNIILNILNEKILNTKDIHY